MVQWVTPAEWSIVAAASAPERPVRGTISPACMKALFTRHCAHSASKMPGARNRKYIGSKNMGRYPFDR
jgi:hypothetical protein